MTLLYATMDLNSDGRLDLDELAAFVCATVEAHYHEAHKRGAREYQQLRGSASGLILSRVLQLPSTGDRFVTQQAFLDADLSQDGRCAMTSLDHGWLFFAAASLLDIFFAILCACFSFLSPGPAVYTDAAFVFRVAICISLDETEYIWFRHPEFSKAVRVRFAKDFITRYDRNGDNLVNASEFLFGGLVCCFQFKFG